MTPQDESTNSTASEPPQTSKTPPPKRRPKPLLLDGTFYEVISDKAGNIEARCTECQEIKKGSVFSTGNFLGHYRIKHVSLVEKMIRYINKKSDRSTDSNLVQQTMAVVAPAVPKVEVKDVLLKYFFFRSHHCFLHSLV